jgi:hypothetical protein
MIKKILLILVLIIISTDIRAEGYHCYHQMNNEHFAKEGEELRAYTFEFLILRKDNQFYEVNDWSNAYDLRLLDRLEIIFENDKVIHLYSNDTDSSMYSMVIDKNNKYFTHSLTTSYGLLGGFDGRCEFISDDEVWKFE